MSDIVDRLRIFGKWNNKQSRYEPVPLCREAADEITRLRAENERLKAAQSDILSVTNCDFNSRRRFK